MRWNYLSTPKLQRWNRWSLVKDKYFLSYILWACGYISMLRLKLSHVSKRGPWRQQLWYWWRQMSSILKCRMVSLLWHHNGPDGVSNHQPHHCLLNSLFRCRSKKTSKLRVTGICAGNSPAVNSPHKWPVTRKMLPFDDVIMSSACVSWVWRMGLKWYKIYVRLKKIK